MPQPPPGRTGTGAPVPPTPPPGPPRYVVATDQSDTILPFLASGGYTFWPSPPVSLVRDGVPIDYHDFVKGDGAQLVCAAFIPWGRVGFLKEIRVAPLKASILADVWNTSGITGADAGGGAFGTYQAHREIETYSGLWDLPMGWESYDWPSSLAMQGGFVPDPWLGHLAWQWQLTVIDKTIQDYKTAASIPKFDPLVPESWYLAESIPVPAATYANGFPGRPIGLPQRMQVLPGDSLKTHAVVPSNSTICLWARWCQFTDTGDPSGLVPGVRLAYSATDPASRVEYPLGGLGESIPVPIIGPSIGSLHGYTQPEVSHGSNVNATTGWGG